jgi:outer membrane protein assembly factor BamD (BamD/ComL family)
MRFAKTIIAAVAVAAAIPAAAQVSADPARFSPLATGYMERARAMSDAGNYAGVIDQLRHLDTQQVALDPAMAEEYTYLLANAYYERDDEECLALLMQFRDSYPASPLAANASLAIGDFYFFRHEWPDALEAYSEIDLDRLNRDRKLLYTYRIALADIKTGHFKEARPLVRSLKGAAGYEDAYWFYNSYLDYIDGDFTRAYDGFSRVTGGKEGLEAGYYMAQIEYSRGEYDNVISRGRALLRRNPVEELVPEMQRIVGLSYFKNGDDSEAYSYLTDYMRGVQGTPSPDAVYALGAVEYAEGRYSAAAQRFESLTDNMDAVGQGAWLYLGQCYLKQDNASSAAMAFEKATRMNFDRKVSETALYNYVTALTRGGKVPFSSSSELLEKFVRLYPDSEYTPEVEAYLATAYYNDRDYTKALECIDAIRNPTSAMLATRQKILYELGIESVTNGRAEQATGYLRQAVALRQHDRNLAAQASLWLGDALFSLGRFREAQQSYEAFIKDDTSRENRALGYYDLAYAKYKQKNYRGAASDFASALSARPALPAQLTDDARIRRADCLYYEGSYAEAAALYTQAIDNGANDTDYALYRRAILRGLAGDTKSKLSDLSRVEQEFPNSRWLSKALLEQALTYEETGRTDLAADAYKKRLGGRR